MEGQGQQSAQTQAAPVVNQTTQTQATPVATNTQTQGTPVVNQNPQTQVAPVNQNSQTQVTDDQGFTNFLDNPNDPNQDNIQDNIQDNNQDVDPDDIVPDEYDFSTLDLSNVKNLTDNDKAYVSALGKELNLTNRQAKGLLEKGGKLFLEQQKAYMANQVKAWTQEVVNDPDLGGANVNRTKQNAYKALKTYGSPEFYNLLNATGLASHKEVIKFLNNIGSSLNNDQTIAGDQVAPKPVVTKFYENSPELV